MLSQIVWSKLNFRMNLLLTKRSLMLWRFIAGGKNVMNEISRPKIMASHKFLMKNAFNLLFLFQSPRLTMRRFFSSLLQKKLRYVCNDICFVSFLARIVIKGSKKSAAISFFDSHVSQNKWQSTDSRFNLSFTCMAGRIRTVRERNMHVIRRIWMQTKIVPGRELLSRGVKITIGNLWQSRQLNKSRNFLWVLRFLSSVFQ